MYVRLKRGKQTVFLDTDVSDTFQSVKKRIGEILSVNADDIKLYAEDKERVLEEEATIGGLEIKNDSIIYWVKRVDATSFEPVP